VADVPDGVEGRSPDNPADRRLLQAVASSLGGGAEGALDTTDTRRVDTLTLSDVVVAILESRAEVPLATSAALIRERDGDDAVIHLVLLGDKREPLLARPGTMIAVTYAARHLDEDILAAFGDKEVIVLK
jgi:hypothetical protein